MGETSCFGPGRSIGGSEHIFENAAGEEIRQAEVGRPYCETSTGPVPAGTRHQVLVMPKTEGRLKVPLEMADGHVLEGDTFMTEAFADTFLLQVLDGAVAVPEE